MTLICSLAGVGDACSPSTRFFVAGRAIGANDRTLGLKWSAAHVSSVSAPSSRGWSTRRSSPPTAALRLNSYVRVGPD